jgi:hypothetical protein
MILSARLGAAAQRPPRLFAASKQKKLTVTDCEGDTPPVRRMGQAEADSNSGGAARAALTAREWFEYLRDLRAAPPNRGLARLIHPAASPQTVTVRKKKRPEAVGLPAVFLRGVSRINSTRSIFCLPPAWSLVVMVAAVAAAVAS